jgi:heterodisulfide reductase subunit A
MDVFILYRDMRPYGLREALYREARAKGIVFVRYDSDKPLEVAPEGDGLRVGFTDRVLRHEMELRPELLVLASAVVPEKDNPLAKFYKVPQNADGFFMEAHAKLRPVDFATDGVFVCGLAHSPKPLDESITQAQAAAARAVTLLSSRSIPVAGTVAVVDAAGCSQCGVCVSICPYSAPKFSEKTGKAEIQSTLCKGCGLCVSSCRSGAIRLKGFDDSQIMAMIQQTA